MACVHVTLTLNLIQGQGDVKFSLRVNCYVPVDYQDYQCEADEWADLIADNWICELAEWDDPLLTSEIERVRNAGIDIELTGYTEEALAELIGRCRIPEILDAGNQCPPIFQSYERGMVANTHEFVPGNPPVSWPAIYPSSLSASLGRRAWVFSATSSQNQPSW